MLMIGRCPISPAVWSPELQKLESHTNTVYAVAFSYDGTLLASATQDRTVRLWNPHAGQEVQKLEGHTDIVHSVTFSHDGTILASNVRRRGGQAVKPSHGSRNTENQRTAVDHNG